MLSQVTAMLGLCFWNFPTVSLFCPLGRLFSLCNNKGV